MLSLCLMYMLLLRSAAKSLYLWSSPILSGCSSRHQQSKLQLPIFPPQGSFTGRSLGDCLAIFLLWHPLFVTSNGGSLAWGGTGTPVLIMTAAHTQGNANLWHDKKKSVSVEDSWLSVLVHHFIGGDVSCDLVHHLPSLFFPPILDLPLFLPGICLSLVLGCQVSSSPCLFFCHSTISVGVLPCSWLDLCNFLQGTPQSISHRIYIHVHTPGGGLSHGGLIVANGGEDKVDQEPRPSSKHQIMWICIQ